MPRRFFRKFAVKRNAFGRQWYIAPFRPWLQDERLWGIRRRTVVPAFALGVFIAFQPVPGHTLIALAMAILLRVNIPVAVLSCWLSNPITVGGMLYAGYELGRRLLDLEPQRMAFDLSWEWFTHTLLANWQPLVLGCLLLGAICAATAYMALDVLWRYSIANYKSEKRRKRH